MEKIDILINASQIMLLPSIQHFEKHETQIRQFSDTAILNGARVLATFGEFFKLFKNYLKGEGLAFRRLLQIFSFFHPATIYPGPPLGASGAPSLMSANGGLSPWKDSVMDGNKYRFSGGPTTPQFPAVFPQLPPPSGFASSPEKQF